MRGFFFSILLFTTTVLTAQTWTNISDPGITIPRYTTGLCTDKDGNIYQVGLSTNGKYNVFKWNGSAWSQLGSSPSSLDSPSTFNICSDKYGNIYAGGMSPNAGADDYAAKWDGLTWTILAPLPIHELSSMSCDASGLLYIGGWGEASGKNNVWKWNNTTWSSLGVGSNALNSINYVSPIVFDASGNIYVPFNLTNGTNGIAKWNGSNWSTVGSINNVLNMFIDQTGSLYVTSANTNVNGKYYIDKWDGSTWTTLSLETNAYIRSICSDASGNLYVAGTFTNSSNKQYVAKWDGLQWTEVASPTSSLNANEDIFSMVIDKYDNIYVVGNFKDQNGNCYLARWGTDMTTETLNNDIANNQLAYPNPTTGIITFDLPCEGMIYIYDNNGRLVLNKEVASGKSIVNINSECQGIYNAVLLNKGREVLQTKIIKQ